MNKSNDDIVAGVYLAERLNTVLSENWQSFATQNYFDTHGVFLSVLWSGPLLIISIVILVSALLFCVNANFFFLLFLM